MQCHTRGRCQYKHVCTRATTHTRRGRAVQVNYWSAIRCILFCECFTQHHPQTTLDLETPVTCFFGHHEGRGWLSLHFGSKINFALRLRGRWSQGEFLGLLWRWLFEALPSHHLWKIGIAATFSCEDIFSKMSMTVVYVLSAAEGVGGRKVSLSFRGGHHVLRWKPRGREGSAWVCKWTLQMGPI